MKNKRTLQQLAVAGVIAVIAALATPAMAVAAPNPAPGAAKAPTLMFEETFENQQQTAAGPLASYAGTSGTTYTADAQWLMASACNGILVMRTSTFADDQCTGGGNPRENVRALADALGGATNHAVTAYTHQGHPSTPGATLLVESQKSGVTLKENRFYVSSIDLAEVNCVIGATHSAIQFGLETAGGEVIMDPTPAVVCAGATSDAPQVGTRTSDGFMPNASQAGAAQYIARNLTVSGQGNDFAYDNLRLFDATPSLFKGFDKSEVKVGETSTMTFTVVNTTEKSKKEGWSFADALPSGMVVADTPNVSSDCTSADVTAAAGATSISIGNGTIARGMQSCQISLDVTLTKAGTFENVIEGAVGLDGQPSAQITAIAPPVPHLTLTKKAIPAELAPNDTEVTYRFTVTNDGQLPLTDVSVSDPGPAGGKGTMSPVTCESNEVLPVGASRDCTATYTASPDDHNGKPLKNTAVANAEADGVAVTSNPATAEVTTIVPAPKLSLTKAAVGGPATSAGQKIQYRFTVTNSGNVDVKTVTVKEGSFSGKGTLGPVVCPADVASLAVEASVTCTADYTVVAADLTGSPITNTATASGVSAFGPVVSEQADAKVPTVKPASGGLAQTGGDSMLLAGGIAGLLLLSGALTLIIVKRRNSMS